MSREINPWKGFDLLRGSNLRPLAPSAGCLTARPPELKWCINANVLQSHFTKIVVVDVVVVVAIVVVTIGTASVAVTPRVL